MKAKALVPAALLLGLAGAANAQLVVYGLFDASVGKSILDDIAGLRTDFHSGGDNGSGEGNSTTRFGLKGSTDVGSGIKANFNLQSSGITSSGRVGGTSTFVDGDGNVQTVNSGAFFNRQAWVGFSGGFGEFRFGRQDNVSFQTLIDYDLNGWSNGVPVSFMNLMRDRQSRSLQYISPDFGGAKIQLGFVPKGNEAAPFDQDVVSIGATYAAGPLSVSATAETKREEDGKTFIGAAGSYDLKVVKIALGATKDTNGFGAVKRFSAGVVAPVAGVNIGAHLGQMTGDSKSTGVEVFVNSEIFKNTTAYLEAGHEKFKKINNVDTDIKGTGFALGVIYVF